MSWHSTFRESGTVADGVDRYLGPARVIEVDRDACRALVEVPANDGARPLWAEVAVPDPAAVAVGRTVLAVTAGADAAYVIGVLGHPLAAPAGETVESRGGSRASIVPAGQADRIQVRNQRRELLFEYDEAKRHARVCVPAGDLDVVVPDGNLTLASNKALRLRGRTVEVAATTGIRLAVHDLATGVLNAIGLTHGGTRVKSRKVRIEAAAGEIAVKTGKLTAERIETDATLIRTRAERIDTDAGTIVERAGHVYQQVKGLIQTRAGRVRNLVTGTWHYRAKRADLRTKDVFKIDGDRIHLG